MQIRKPIIGHGLLKPAESLGNEGLDIRYTIFRVDVTVGENDAPREWYLPFSAVKLCLSWVRVAERQYWVGVLMGAANNLARGTLLINTNGETVHQNFGAYQMPIAAEPLTKEKWKAIGHEIEAGHLPAIPDLMFCDALLSFRDHDYLQTVIRLGIACELELNAFLDDLLTTQSEVVNRLYSVARQPFDWKLKNMPQMLGATTYQHHNERFAALLCKLYELRGAAVHRAECLVQEPNDKTGQTATVSVGFEHISDFIFAVDNFLCWTKSQRAKLGLGALDVVTSGVKYTLGGG
jgi:hypothetical protein